MEALTLDISAIGGLSDDELFQLCAANRGIQIERSARGELILISPTGGSTGARSLRLGSRLFSWNEASNLGVTFDSNTGFVLPDGAMRAADAAWVRLDRWEALTLEQQKRFPPLCPDFIIELRSESDRLLPLQQKMEEWIANGCRLAWLIDPEEESVGVYRADGSVEMIASFDGALSGEDILPGFELRLPELR